MLKKITFYIKQKLNPFKANSNAKQYKDVINNNSKFFGNVTIDVQSKLTNSNLCGAIQIGKNNDINNSILEGNISTLQNCKLHRCEIVGNVSLGRNTSLWGPNLDIYTNENSVEIGSYCSIARNVSFQTYNHNAKKITSYFIGANFFNEQWANEQVSKGKIVVGNDVWIGSHCVILGGVTIGNGAIIAANSVVNKDIPAYSIVGGSPAKIIAHRFELPIINALQKLQWWNWNNEDLHKNKVLFEQELTLDFLQKFMNEQ